MNCSSRNLENHFTNIQWPNTTIKEILFEHNDLVHVTPFPRIIVEKLILRRNKISVIDYHAFKELVNLTELDLSHNQLTSERLQPHVFEVTKWYYKLVRRLRGNQSKGRKDNLPL